MSLWGGHRPRCTKAEGVKSVEMIKDAEAEDEFVGALGLKMLPAKALRKRLGVAVG